MKRSIYSLFLILFVLPLYAQQTGPLFRPSKVSYYNAPNGSWNLEMVRTFTYDSKGNAILTISKDGSGAPIRKDSAVFSPNSQAAELYRSFWNSTENKFVPEEKLINTYDAQDRLIFSAIYIWLDEWMLLQGTEHLISYDPVTKTETDIQRIYDVDTQKWGSNFKTVTTFDALGQKTAIVISVTDGAGGFEWYSRQTFAGWHNYEKDIDKGQTTERYINGAWVTEKTSSTEQISGMWVKTEGVATGPAAGTYKTIFEEDYSYREFLQQHGQGWLSLSTSTRTGKVNKTVNNQFNGDIVIGTQTDERETDDQGALIRTTLKSQGPNQETLSFTEVLTDIQYDTRNLPLEEISKTARTEDRSNYELTEKVVYADYVDVRLTTALEENATVVAGAQIRVFPNPSSGRFNLTEEVAKVAVYSMDGQLLRNLHPQDNVIDLTDLPAGIYQLQMGTEISRQKVVITAQ